MAILITRMALSRLHTSTRGNERHFTAFVFVVIPIVPAAAGSGVRCLSGTDVTSSSSVLPVPLPCVDGGEIPQITCDDVAGTTEPVGRLSALPPPASSHRRAVTQSAAASTTTVRCMSSTDRRGGWSNGVKRHSTSLVTSSPSANHDGGRHQHRRSALLLPSTSSSDIHR